MYLPRFDHVAEALGAVSRGEAEDSHSGKLELETVRAVTMRSRRRFFERIDHPGDATCCDKPRHGRVYNRK